MKAPCASPNGPGERPVMIPQIACLVDGGAYVAAAGTDAARELAALPAIRHLHDYDDPRHVQVTAADRTELLDAASRCALAAGWVQRVDGYWLCPRHAGTYLDRDPKRFTVRECMKRHRLRHNPDSPR